MPLEFIISPRLAATGLREALDRLGKLRDPGRTPLALTCYDSFDGRLRRAGFEYAVEEAHGALVSVCRDARGERCEALPLAVPPRFAGDLPVGHWHGRLAAALDVRALLPRVELSGERSEWVLESEGGEVMVCFALDILALNIPGAPISLPPRLRITPVKVFRKLFRQTVDQLREALALETADRGYLSEALHITGQTPESAIPRIAIPIESGGRADAAVKQVLRTLLDTLRANEAGVLVETDTEFLHDFRVAVRRTRAVLRQINKVFPDRLTQRYTQGFAKLAQTTGEARDMDVYLLALERLEAGLPLPLRGHLGPLRELLQKRAIKAHAGLNRHLRSMAYRTFMHGWEAFLAAPPPKRPRAEQAQAPIDELASRRIWKLYRRALREGGAITAASPPESLHELRKTAKKLRYLMELFGGLYPADQSGALLKDLKSLQNVLGDYQDIDVQIARLQGFAGELRSTGAPVEALLSIGALLGRLYRRETKLRADFSACFAGFAKPGHKKKWRSLLMRDRPIES
jgi:CHAD domain-containing protein